MPTRIQELVANIKARTTDFERGINRTISGTERLRQKWGRAARDVSTAASRVGLAVGAVGGVVGGVALKKFADFEEQMTRVGAVTRTLGERDFKLLREAALQAGESTRFSATQAAGAIEKLGLAGLNTSEITGGALTGSLQLAQSAQIDIAKAADIAAKQMRAFGLEASDLARVNDTLLATTTRANTNIGQLAQALKPVAPLADQAGVSLETTTALLAKMADAGFQGSIAGVALRRAFINLASPSKKAAQILERFNVQASDPFLQKLRKIQEGLQDATSDMGKFQRRTEQTRIAAEIFGARAAPQIIAAMKNGVDAIREFAQGTRELGGIAQRMEEAQLDTLAGQFDILRAAIEGVFISTGQKLNPAFRRMIDQFKQFIRANKPAIVDAMSDSLHRLTDVLEGVWRFLRRNQTQLAETGQAFGSFVAPVLEFIAKRPELAAMLGLLKVSNLLGITQAVRSLGSAFAETARTIGLAKTAAVGFIGVGLVAGFRALTSSLEEANQEFRESLRNLRELREERRQREREERDEKLAETETPKERLKVLKEERKELERQLKHLEQQEVAAKRIVESEKKRQREVDSRLGGFVGMVRGAAETVLGPFTSADNIGDPTKTFQKNLDEAKKATQKTRDELERLNKQIEDTREQVRKNADPAVAPQPTKPAKAEQPEPQPAVAGQPAGGGPDAEEVEKRRREEKNRAKEADRAIGDLNSSLSKLATFSKDSSLQSIDLSVKLNDLKESFVNGKLTTEQFKDEVDALRQATEKAIKAEQRARKLRILTGEATEQDIAFLKAKVRQKRQGALTDRVNRAFSQLVSNLAGINRESAGVRNGFVQLNSRMRDFGRTVQDVRRQISPEQARKGLAQLTAFLGSRRGKARAVFNQIQLLKQQLPILDTFRQRQEVRDEISRLRDILNRLRQSPAPVFSQVGGEPPFLEDPGLQRSDEDTGGGGNTFQVNFNALSQPSSRDIRRIVDQLQQELHRRGRHF